MGLGNRLTLLCAGYASAKVNGANFISKWDPGTGCKAEWSDLFKKPTLFEQVSDRIPGDCEVFQSPSFGETFMQRGKHERAAGDKFASADYWRYFRECARSVELVEELALPDKKDFIAVSIRANWKPRSPEKNWSKNLRLPSGSFICSDSKAAFATARRCCEDSWHLSSPTTNRDMGNRGNVAVKAAARDMMMLTKASMILTIGPHSTFRNVAALGYEVPVFRMDKSLSP